MYNPVRDRLLRLLRVPPEPHAPAGSPGSLQVFRAGRNYFRLRIWRWTITQLLALGGIIFWTTILVEIEAGAKALRAERAAAAAAVAPTAAPSAPKPDSAAPADNLKASVARVINAGGKKKRVKSWAEFKHAFAEIAAILPEWAFPLVWLLKILGFVVYLVQIPITYAARRLDYEMHWYMVTDRSLRLRTGIWKVQELTMSFANIQQVEVTQGPLQRLLGIADVRVESAGGSSGGPNAGDRTDSLHAGRFHSVDNAMAIRDLILERLRRFRESGLGDPDDARAHAPAPSPAAADESAALLAAARDFRAEAAALRAQLAFPPAP